MTAAPAGPPAARRFITLTENSSNPVQGLGITDRDLDLLVSALALAGFARGISMGRRGGRAIQTGSKVGVIQIGGEHGWQVEVKPKFGDLETFAMLQGLWALGGAAWDDPDDFESPPLVKAESTHDFFVSWALRRIVRFLERSLRREYRPQLETFQGAVRGRINAKAWAASWSRGRPFDIPCEHYVYDVDTPPNRIVRAGLEKILGYLVMFRPKDSTSLTSCRSALAHLRSVRTTTVRAADFQSMHYDRVTRRYRPVHAICQRLLVDSGLGHHGDANGAPFVSFGFDLAREFQDLLLLLLRRVSGGVVQSEPRFYYRWEHEPSGRAGRPHLKPDYLVASTNEVLDAKYKDVLVGTRERTEMGPDDLTIEGQHLRLNRADVYQAIAYTAHEDLRASRVTFVFPVCRGDPTQFPRVFHLGGFKARAAVRVGVMHLGGPETSVPDRIELWERQIRTLLESRESGPGVNQSGSTQQPRSPQLPTHPASGMLAL